MIAKNPAAALWASVAFVSTVFLFVTATIALGSPADEPLAAPAATGERVEVSLTEFALAPAALTVRAGVPVTLAAANDGAIEHDVTIDEVGTSGPIGGGADGELALDPLEPGSYEVYCSIPGHAASGMTATLTVTDEAAEGGDQAARW